MPLALALELLRSCFHSVEMRKLDPPRGPGSRCRCARARNSLIPEKSSLFPEIFSLLTWVGNFATNRCSAAISLSALGSQSLKIAKFPVKLPVSRELARRRVRSALRRQPTSPALGHFTLSNLRNTRQWRAFGNWLSVSGLRNRPLRERNSR
jgi:hypothetical protein